MAQHFLLSKAAKTLSLAQVFRMSDEKAEETFALIRWPETKGAPVCPHCGGVDAYDCRRPNGAPRFRCRACAKDFTLTSGTLFASHKLPLCVYLAAIAIFCNEVKGKSALAISRDLGLAYKSAFVPLHKLREAMAGELKDRIIGGDGKTAEVDGGFFGGYVKPANRKEDRVDLRLASNQNGKRQCVVIVRERNGNSVPAVFKSESHAAAFIKARVTTGTKLNADEAGAWDSLHKNFGVARINHQEAYSLDIKDLDKIDWKILQARDFKRDNEDLAKTARYQAEILVHKAMPIEAMLCVVCYNKDSESRLKGLCEQAGVKLAVFHRSGWYF
ncbi:MAG: IS1595 family transposase [Rhodomicrobium sp.]